MQRDMDAVAAAVAAELKEGADARVGVAPVAEVEEPEVL